MNAVSRTARAAPAALVRCRATLRPRARTLSALRFCLLDTCGACVRNARTHTQDRIRCGGVLAEYTIGSRSHGVAPAAPLGGQRARAEAPHRQRPGRPSGCVAQCQSMANRQCLQPYAGTPW
eukprot:3358036-Prymnesium_polylepis.1